MVPEWCLGILSVLVFELEKGDDDFNETLHIC